ncbi:uncharacterized protein J3D65DRAFT_94235 [Phyllosticta citribraziliensis]|uniref:Uncharacterized protein n=1 Tax=Phyllosticta citribraziliensis TaxID=989973 RepID=A0ABR1LCD1_9PEZI
MGDMGRKVSQPVSQSTGDDDRGMFWLFGWLFGCWSMLWRSRLATNECSSCRRFYFYAHLLSFFRSLFRSTTLLGCCRQDPETFSRVCRQVSKVLIGTIPARPPPPPSIAPPAATPKWLHPHQHSRTTHPLCIHPAHKKRSMRRPSFDSPFHLPPSSLSLSRQSSHLVTSRYASLRYARG